MLTLVLGTTLFCNTKASEVKLIEVSSFEELKKVVTDLGEANLAHTLLVMDNDDTLTMMSCPDQNNLKTCQYLGGPAWFSWQNSLLSTASPYRVATEFDDLLKISTLLFAINYMEYTEEDVPTVLQSLVNSQVRLLVLTARGTDTSAATANQFSHHVLSGKNSKYLNFLDLISQNALVGKKSSIPGIASPYQPCGNVKARAVSYQNGVMYVAGQNKGQMLKCLLEATDSSTIQNIIFIDDTYENVKDVYEAFKTTKMANVISIHYTALSAHKDALTTGPNAKAYQENSNRRWNAIKSVLKKELQTPAIP